MNTRPMSLKLAVSGFALTAMLSAQAANTDLATAPLITSSSTSVLPNVFLILDDSGSMDWDYMPDNASKFTGTYGGASSQCNGVFYNPNIRYLAPVTATGANYADSSFTSALKDGYKPSLGSTNLSTGFVSPGGDPAQAAFYYTYQGTQTTEAQKSYYDTASTFYRECLSPYATITVSGTTSTSVTSVKVGTTTITSGSTTASTTPNTVASRIVNAIKQAGYNATSSGSVVTITGPTINVPGLTPVVTATPTTGMTFTTTSFTSAPFTKVVVSATSGPATADINGDGVVDAADKNEITNFANWYSYYRTRILMMKTATGLAFKPIGGNYRVGYSSINNNTTSDYLGLNTFDATQKAAWYAKLYAATPGNMTPLRQALSNVGKMYAGKLSTLNGSTVVDPIQYACQQNFTILTTDGFWNSNAGSKLDGTAVGNQDGNDVRPMYDGAVQEQRTSQNLQTDTQLTLTTSQTQQWTQQLQSRTSSLQRRTGTLQWQTNLQQTTAPLQWQTKQQQTTETLQWQTNLQRTYGQLAMWTDQMEVKAPLQWSATEQRTSGILQRQVSQLQTRTSLLQRQTSQLQRQISQLQKQTSQLQRSTSSLQKQTSQLQKQTQRFRKCTNTGSPTWGTCTDVSFDCTTGTGDAAYPYCRAGTPSGWSNVSTCTTGTTNPATFCRTVVATAYTNVSSCTATTTPNASGITTQCQYTAWSTPTGASSCTPLAQSTGPSYTVGTATQCQTVVTSPWANATSCTATTTPDASGNTTQCAYVDGAWTGVSSCTPVAKSTGPTYNGGGTATQCQTVVTSPYANAASCNASATPDASGYTTQCQYTAWSGWSNTGSCTVAAQSTGPSYTTATARDCQYATSAWTNVGAGGTCTFVAQSAGPTNYTVGTATDCRLSGATTAYVTLANPSCSVTYNNPGTSTADSGGMATSACTVAAPSTPAPVGAGQTCATSANITCSTGTPLPASYVTNYPVPSCTVTYNAGGSSTADASGNVVTSCPTDGSGGPSAMWSPATPVGPNNSCDWNAPHAGNPHMYCFVVSGVTDYVTTFPPSCATTTVSGTGYVTADASGNITWSCSNTGGTYSAAQTVPNNATCVGGPIATGTGGGSVQCVTSTPSTSYVATYPGTCAVTYNGLTGTSTANGTTVVTACPVSGTFSTAANVGAGNSCNGALTNIQCSTGTASTAYVATYPPSCAINFNAAGTSTADASGKVVTACPVNAAFNGWNNATGSCTPGANVNCQYVWGGWSNAASCTTNFSSGAGTWSVTTGTDCQYTAYTGWSDLAATSCTDVVPSPTSPYTVGTARNCRVVNVTTPANTPANPAPAWVATGSCTPMTPGTFNAAGQNIQCQTVTTGPTPVASCTPGTIAANSGNNWTTTTCANNTLRASEPVLSCTASGPTAANNYVTTTCPAPLTTGPTVVAGCTPSSAAAANNWTTTTCTAQTGTGTSDTLADVAEYYYLTDLRTVALGNNLSGAPGAVNGTDISANIVPSGGTCVECDKAAHQHMTTFTLGLGARGRMVFDPSYQSATTGDFYAVKQGSTANGTTVCPWQTSGACNWPTPSSGAIENIDDLWHTAVNGRGTYFSATDPSGLALGLSNALAGVSARLGAASAATTSTAFITPGDNFLFHSSYASPEWTGNLVRYQIDPVTGSIMSTADWSAQVQLDAVADYTTRNIYFFNAASATKLSPFVYANLSPAQQSSFALGNLLTLAQFCSVGATCLSAADQSLAAGANLVNYIRGDRTNAGALADNTKYYRERKHQLGDLVNSESVYVKRATAGYTDAGYSGFKSTVSTRLAMVYIGGNDGMLHAFDATTGDEKWAYIPTQVIPNLHYLADKNYGPLHRYFVDASPVVGDVCTGGCGGAATWKTILVGGLGGGGKGYYALDITDPLNPKALWEFTDANMGYTYGNPYIVKQGDGTWVVIVSSGYNNTTGDGMGHLYVLDAGTGTLIRDISTGVGSPTAPSGLSRISVPVQQPGYDATAMAVYAGDNLGSLWRFDINNNLGAGGYDAQLMATLRDAAGNPQPITAKPTVGLSGTTMIVYVGTGRYLGLSDISDSSQQSLYAIKDTFPTGTTPSAAIWGDPRIQGTFVKQTVSIGPCPVGAPPTVCSPGATVQIVSKNPVDLAVNGGWYIDFPIAGERNNTDPIISKGTVILTTNLPSLSSCEIGGRSFLYQLDYLSGAAGGIAASSGVGGIGIANEISSRPVVATLSDNTVKIYVQGSSGSDVAPGGASGTGGKGAGGIITQAAVGTSSVGGIVRNVSWRELIQQ